MASVKALVVGVSNYNIDRAGDNIFWIVVFQEILMLMEHQILIYMKQ